MTAIHAVLRNNRFFGLIFIFIFFTVACSLAQNKPSPPLGINTNKLLKSATDIKPEALDLALKAYEKAYKQGYVKKPYLAVIDYSKPSTDKRLWIFDLAQEKVLYELHVTHGKNSGVKIATKFSNKQDSLQTSLGAFITEEPYNGRNGYSLRLEGLDPGLNDNAKKRGIVIHGAHYASANFLQKNGRLGLSWGCPAIAKEVNAEVINLLKDGSMVYAYHFNL